MKLSYALLALVGLSEAGRKKKPHRAVTTSTTSTTTATTSTTATLATDSTVVAGDTGSVAAQLAGNWHITEGTGVGDNVNVMLNSGNPVTTATIVTTNNAGNLVTSVVQATLDEAAGTITVNGNVGTIQPDGTVLFADGTKWGAGAATVTTAAPATTVAPGGTAAPGGAGDPYGSGSSGGSSGTYTGGSSGGSSGTYTGGSTGGSSGTYTDGSTGGDAYSGSGTGTGTGYTGTGTGYVSGDPHVRIEGAGQKAVCYDIHGDSLDYVSLLYDVNTGLEINGQLTHLKENKDRLSAIGFKTEAGVEIGVFADRVTVGFQGKIEDQYDYEDYMRITTDDATIEILSKHDAKHQGVIIQLDSGSLFHVEDKDFKESMKLEILRSDGMSGRLSGVLGQTIQPKDYIINPDGSIAVEDRFIMSSTWDEKNKCQRIRDFDVREFLGHSVYDYAVSGIFSTIDQAWLTIELGYETDPK